MKDHLVSQTCCDMTDWRQMINNKDRKQTQNQVYLATVKCKLTNTRKWQNDFA